MCRVYPTLIVWMLSTVLCVSAGKHWWEECAKVCRCLSTLDPETGIYRRVVDCSGGRIQRKTRLSLPPDVHSLNLSRDGLLLSDIVPIVEKVVTLHNLNLSSNAIWRMRDFKSIKSHLGLLDLSQNRISGLPGEWLLYRDQLSFLNLSHNKLEFIHKAAFSNLDKLKRLDVSNNGILHLNKEWFSSLLRLETLDFSHNRLTALSSKLFEDLKSLIKLDLSNNRIGSMNIGSFHGLSKLKYLYLNGNRLQGILAEKLDGPQMMHVLDLTNNGFTSIETHTFIDVKAERIVLNKNNNLKYIQRDAFVNIPQLRALEISNCPKLEYIDFMAFNNIPSLQTLSLEDNGLRAVFNQTIASLEALQRLSIRGNPVVCDCNVHWLLAEPRNGLHVVDLNDTVCHGPSLLGGRILSPSLRWYVSSVCPPNIVTDFPPLTSPLFGEDLLMECYATGNPPPDVYWLFTSTNSSSCADNATRNLHPFASGGSLSLQGLTQTNSGQYSCVAQNLQGQAIKCFQVNVQRNTAEVVVLGTGEQSILVTWKGTQIHKNYNIIYREMTNSSTVFRSIDIQPGMRKININNLKVSSEFEICITLKTDRLHLDRKCKVCHTSDHVTGIAGIRNTRSLFIGLCVGGFLLILVCACVVCAAIKKYNKSQSISRYMLPQSTSRQRIVSSSERRSSVGSPTTYENKMLELSDEECFIEESEASFPAVAT